MEEICHQASSEGWSGTFRNNVNQEASSVLTWNQSADGSCQFQKSTKLLIKTRPLYQMVREVLQAEKSWLKIQASTVMAFHEASEAYFICLLEDSHICAIHAKWKIIIPKDMQLVRQIHGEM